MAHKSRKRLGKCLERGKAEDKRIATLLNAYTFLSLLNDRHIFLLLLLQKKEQKASAYFGHGVSAAVAEESAPERRTEKGRAPWLLVELGSAGKLTTSTTYTESQ